MDNIEKFGVVEAEKNILAQLQKYVEFVGTKDKFNVTLTVGATRVVYHFKQKSESSNFVNFLKEFPRLKTNFKTIMGTHYGFDIYNSEKAKTEFLKPDLVPFDY